MSAHQALGLFDRPADDEPDIPLLYLAMPLSHLKDRGEREQVELLAHTVTRALDDASQKSTDPWRVSVHSPATWSAPWKRDGRTPEGIYRLNSKTLWEEADALIVIGHRGGSLGSGQELTWAGSLHLPMLYVHIARTPVSRQLHGASREHDLQVSAYNSPDELSDIVGRWLCSRRHIIADGPRRRRNRMLRFAELQTRLRYAWEALTPAARDHVVLATRIAPGRVVRLLDSPGALSQAATCEVSELAAALYVEIASLVGVPPLPDLRTEQRSALVNAATEFGWDTQETFALYDAARVELARGGIRRMPLASAYDWRVFRERIRNGR
ncbi:MAG: hypothetical protein QOH12_341 [Solirubrobacteraceae bacterium]|nr:hypothetical protein [Solirubrobacteraceae bacterium]